MLCPQEERMIHVPLSPPRHLSIPPRPRRPSSPTLTSRLRSQSSRSTLSLPSHLSPQRQEMSRTRKVTEATFTEVLVFRESGISFISMKLWQHIIITKDKMGLELHFCIKISLYYE